MRALPRRVLGRKRADELIRRLRLRFAPGGLLHYGQGKWYPRESSPRWALALYWRRDGVPIWHDDGLIAPEATDCNVSSADTQTFAQEIATRLGLRPHYAQPVYEDPVDRMLKHGLVPKNIDLRNPKLDDPLVRARMLKILDERLSEPAGFVVPLQRWTADAKSGWLSEIWCTRRGRLFLASGDTPLGQRLPIQSLPSVDPLEYPYVIPIDPFAEREPLNDWADCAVKADRACAGGADRRSRPASETLLMQRRQPAIERQALPRVPVRTALTVEARDGRLCVFMPPLETLNDYLELIATIEETAAKLGLPIHIEGYAPPPDPRLNVLKVTPDPGVIEVNVQPAATWREAVDIAMESGAKELILYHHDPDHTDAIVDKVVADARNYYPKVRAAAEGLVIRLGDDKSLSATQARR